MRSYLSYIQNVLGVREFLGGQSSPQKVADVPAKQWRVLFLTSNDWSFHEQDLFFKICEAMKISEKDYMLRKVKPEAITNVIKDIENSKNTVCFSFELKAALGILGYESFFSPDPQNMLKNPGLKKEAWDVLKKL